MPGQALGYTPPETVMRCVFGFYSSWLRSLSPKWTFSTVTCG